MVKVTQYVLKCPVCKKISVLDIAYEKTNTVTGMLLTCADCLDLTDKNPFCAQYPQQCQQIRKDIEARKREQ